MTSGFFYKQQQVVNVDCLTNESVGSFFWFYVINLLIFLFENQFGAVVKVAA